MDLLYCRLLSFAVELDSLDMCKTCQDSLPYMYYLQLVCRQFVSTQVVGSFLCRFCRQAGVLNRKSLWLHKRKEQDLQFNTSFLKKKLMQFPDFCTTILQTTMLVAASGPLHKKNPIWKVQITTSVKNIYLHICIQVVHSVSVINHRFNNEMTFELIKLQMVVYRLFHTISQHQSYTCIKSLRYREGPNVD